MATIYVSEDVPLQAPVARDDYVAYTELPEDGSAVRVRVVDNDDDPDGSVDEIEHRVSGKDGAQEILMIHGDIDGAAAFTRRLEHVVPAIGAAEGKGGCQQEATRAVFGSDESRAIIKKVNVTAVHYLNNDAIFSGLTADYYGAPTPLQQLVSFNVEDARTVKIVPFDVTALAAGSVHRSSRRSGR